LAATKWEEAAEANEHACGKRISKQTWAIVAKIKEVDEFLSSDIQRQDLVREIHPEVLFQALNYGLPLAAKKKSSAGRFERIEIIERHLPGGREFFEKTSRRYPRSDLQLDDILDAMSAALVASQYSNQLRTMPSTPPVDSAGIRCEIVVPSVRELPLAAVVRVEMRSETGKLLYRSVIDEAAFEDVRALLEAKKMRGG
jgi:predicted RNase H-like nuclease